MSLYRSVVAPTFLLAFAAACSSDPGYAGSCPLITPAEACTTANNYADDTSFVTPTIVHTGYNGRDTYQAVLVANFGQFELSSSKNATVCAARFDCPAPNQQGVIALLTAQSPGDAVVTVSSNQFEQEINVVVTGYSTADHDIGGLRYNDPTDANSTTRRACGGCHLGGGGAPHSPLALARFSDRELIYATLNSQYPGTCEDGDGANCDCTPNGEDCSACAQSCTFNDGNVLSLADFGGGPGDHSFDLTAAEEVGIMAFMRSIEPEGI